MLFAGPGQKALELTTAIELNNLQTQSSLDRLATACERLLIIVIAIAILLGVSLIGYVVKKVYHNHSNHPKMTGEGPTPTTMTGQNGNDIRH